MFNNSGLSLEQAPPIKVILRLFFTGSFFGIIVGGMLFFNGEHFEHISDSETIATVHLLLLGVVTSFMLGALFQMLPVICGVSIKKPNSISLAVNITLVLGVLALAFSFFYPTTLLYITAAMLLGFSLLGTAYIMIKELTSITHSNSSRGMLLAISSLVLLVLLGITLLAIRAGMDIDIAYTTLKKLHFSFALFGWIALLIVSVSFQVIEMFYVTPPYPSRYARYLPTAIFLLLLLNIPLFFIVGDKAEILDYLVVLLLSIHAIVTLRRLYQKKRPLLDATFLFWNLAMGSFLLFAISLFLRIYIPLPITLSAVAFSCFVLSVIFAMNYKIVPFLVWFHLNAKGYFDAPMMHEVVHPKYAKRNLYLFATSFLFLLVAPFIPLFWKLGALFWIASFAMLFWAIANAVKKYNYTLTNGTKFDFGAGVN